MDYPEVALTLRDIAERLHCRLEGAVDDVDIVRVAGIEQAGPGDLTFVANPRYHAQLRYTRASAVILGEGDQSAAPCPVLRSDNPYRTFAEAVSLFHQPAPPVRGIDPLSSIAADATIGPEVSVGPFVVIGSGAAIGARTIIESHVVIGAHAEVGSDCLLHSHVAIRDGVSVGHRVIIHDGAVLGSDGFGYVRRPDGSHMKIPQIAAVVIEDDVEIGANTTIDRGAMDDTVIEEGVKLDNQIQIGHNCRIGAHTAIAGCTGIAGSTRIGKYCMVGGGSLIAGHLTIVDRTIISGGTAVIKSIAESGTYTGLFPLQPHAEWIRNVSLVRHLHDLMERIRGLEGKIKKNQGGKK